MGHCPCHTHTHTHLSLSGHASHTHLSLSGHAFLIIQVSQFKCSIFWETFPDCPAPNPRLKYTLSYIHSQHPDFPFQSIHHLVFLKSSPSLHCALPGGTEEPGLSQSLLADSRPSVNDTWGLALWSSAWDTTLLIQGGWGLIPGQGTGSCMPQLKIPCAAIKTQLIQINTFFFTK